jgi:hypothetical protein
MSDMKTTVTLLVVMATLCLTACHGADPKDTKINNAENREAGHPGMPPDTVRLDGADVTIKVVNEKNVNIRNCTVTLSMECKFKGEKADTTWYLPNCDTGEVRLRIYSRLSKGNLNIVNGKNICICDTFSYGFSAHTRIVYVLKNCQPK